MNKLSGKFLSIVQIGGVFFATALLMFIYEILKEIYFRGNLTLWESHIITIIITAIFATTTAIITFCRGNRLVKDVKVAHSKVQGIVTHMFDAVIIIDERGIIETFNPAAEKIFGYTSTEVIGRNISSLMPEPYAQEHDSYLQNYLSSRVPKILGKSRRDVSGLRANGDVFPMELTASEMNIDDRMMFIGIVRDITENKRAEEELNRLREAEKKAFENLQKELSVAAAIQMNMLPKCYYLFPQHPQIKTYGLMLPAKEIGGDFYDAFSVDAEHIVIAIGDVSGKGIPAAMFMMETMTLLRAKITKPKKFATALITVNKLLCENNDTNMFVSVFVGLFNVVTGQLRYVSCGHNPPLLARSDSPFTLLNVPNNILLGVHDEALYEVGQTQLYEGDTLILYTDGVTEAENARQEFFSLERTLEVLTSAYSDVKVLVNALTDEVSEFCGDHPPSDDITIFALQFSPKMATEVKNKFFEWTDEMSVGIDEIDEQHKSLVDLINQLYDEMIVKNADTKIIAEILNDLVQYTIVHFSLEENLFHTFGYPEVETHSGYHAELKNQLLEIQRKSRQNQTVVNTELLRFLKKWLQNHIMVEDKRSFLYLSSRLKNQSIIYNQTV